MSSPQPPTDADYDALRPYYQGELAQGVERFLEPRVEACPWCGSDRLRTRVRARDRTQHKPGRFVLDECRACGHVFQNPRLTPEGLDFYYKDLYDGLGAHQMEPVFEAGAPFNHARVETVKVELAKTGSAPTRWLDVGTGYGYFAKHARAVLPDTEFDGLDMGVGVTMGEERGWLGTGYRGMFPELAPSLTGQYDVVSMHHYLEHTRDPRAELEAAARVVAPGDLLLIEVPDPSYRFARVFGRWWLPLLQPQHLQLIPLGNLVQGLADVGFTSIATASGEAHMGLDATWACSEVLGVFAPDPRTPWLRAGSRATCRKRPGAVRTVVALTLGRVGDKVLTVLAHRMDSGNTYRVLARRDPA